MGDDDPIEMSSINNLDEIAAQTPSPVPIEDTEDDEAAGDEDAE